MGFLVVLIALILGYGLGLYAFSNIVLPLLWSWPKARRLGREGRLTRSIPAALFLIAPFVWSLVLVGSLLLVHGLFPTASDAFVMGLLVGAGQIVRCIFNPNADMETDFADTYRVYLRAERGAPARPVNPTTTARA